MFNQLDDQERWLNLKKALDSSEKCPQSDYTGDSREGQAMTLQFVSSEAPMNHAQGPHLQSSYRAPENMWRNILLHTNSDLFDHDPKENLLVNFHHTKDTAATQWKREMFWVGS